MLSESKKHILNLAIGGTAVGTGINAILSLVIKWHSMFLENTGYPLVSSENKFHALTAHDEVVQLHGTLKALAGDLMKIANDVDDGWLQGHELVWQKFLSLKMNQVHQLCLVKLILHNVKC